MTRALSVAAAALLAAACAAASPRATLPPPQDPEKDPEAAVARLLRQRVDAADGTAPAAGSLSAALRRFYEARAWRRAWTTSHAAELLTVVEAAPADGLRAGDYPLDSIRLLLARAAPDTADLAALDLLLSGTFLLYGQHLSAGRFTPWSVDAMWSAAPSGVDLAAALTIAIDSGRPARVLQALAPPHPGYARLRAHLAGVPAERAGQIEANLERWRWLPRDLGPRYVMVDVPAFTLTVSADGRTVLSARVIAGRPDWPTPITTAAATQVVFHPSWYIPRAIALAEVIPAQIRDPAYLARVGIRVFPARGGGGREIDPATIDWEKVTERSYAYRLVQDPGPANPLGAVRLQIVNPFGVTLHDTPQRELFTHSLRGLSHGCVRVERALELAERLLRDVPGWTPDTIAAVLRAGRERAVVLPEAVSVVLAYWTAWVDEDGALQFRDDLYGWDARLAAALAPPRAAPVSSLRTSASSTCEQSP